MSSTRITYAGTGYATIRLAALGYAAAVLPDLSVIGADESPAAIARDLEAYYYSELVQAGDRADLDLGDVAVAVEVAALSAVAQQPMAGGEVEQLGHRGLSRHVPILTDCAAGNPDRAATIRFFNAYYSDHLSESLSNFLADFGQLGLDWAGRIS